MARHVGRPSKAEKAIEQAINDASPKLFDVKPYTLNASNKIVRYPENVDINDWLKWCYGYLILNKNCVSLLDIWEDENITPTMSFLDTVEAHDPNIDNLIEQRIIKKVLAGDIRADFAKHLLKEKYNWNEDFQDPQSVDLTNNEIKFNFG
jgi:hypothetical protein